MDTPDKTNKQYVSVGVLYDNEKFLWVAHTQIETAINTTIQYPVEGEVTKIPEELDQGESGLIEVEVFVTNPSADLIFTFFNPLGFGDVFNLGNPKLTTGASFGCNDPDNWALTTTPSITRKSIGKIEYKYEGLINSDETHDVTNIANKIILSVPITAMASVDAEGQYAFTVGIQVGTVDVLTVTQDIPVTGTTYSKSPSSGTTTGSIKLINEGEVYPGSAAILQLDIKVPAGTTLDFKLEDIISNTHVSPARAFIKDPGLCGGFDFYQLNNLETSFGVITNVDTSETAVVVWIAMNVAATTAADSLQMSVKLDGQEYTSTILVRSSPNKDPLAGVGTNLGFTTFNTGFETGIKSEIVIPPTMVGEEMTFEVFPDLDVTNFDLRLCRVEVEKVGEGLPCIANSMINPDTSISKSSETRLFEDHGRINLGTSCPAAVSDKDSDRTLTVSFVYQLPAQDTITDGTDITVNGGLYVKNSSLWVTSNTVKSAVASIDTLEPEDTKTYIGVRKQEFEVALNSPFYFRYVIKTNPKSRGKLVFKLEALAAISICQVKVLKIGRNMACAQKPEGYSDKYLQTHLTYDRRFETAGTATLTFDGLTNFGEEEMVPNLYADDNSIEIGAFFRFENMEGSKDVVAYLTGADQRSVDIKVLANGPAADENDPGLDFSWVPVGDGGDSMFLTLPKILAISIDVPLAYKWPIVKIKFADKNWLGKITFCGVHVTKQGLNVPCINPLALPTYPTDSSLFEVDDSGNTINYKEIYLDLSVCHYPLSSDPEQNKFQVEVTIKATSRAVADNVITIEATTDVDGNEIVKETEVKITASDPSFVTVSNETYASVEENTEEIQVGCGKMVWVPFNISVPRATIRLEIAAMTPSVDGKAIMTIEGIRFADSGTNICCTGSNVDPNVVYKPKRERTENTTSFMSIDSIRMDMGLVTNGGYTFRRGFNTEDDDKFIVEIQIKMSDHPLTVATTKFPVRLAANSGNVISVGSRDVTVGRVDPTSRWELERPIISMKMNLTTPGIVFDRGDKINIEAVMYHQEISTGEGKVDSENYVRMILPPWLDYVYGEDTCVTNYTQPNTTDNTCQVRNNSFGRPDFLFSNGINFPDVISVNFSITVDRYDRLGVGRGNVPSMAVSYLICFPAPFGNIPWPTDYEICGPYEGVKIVVASPECYDLISIDPCGVSASSAMDDTTVPANVLLDDDSFWAPAVRTGAGWKHVLDIFFRRKTRLNRIEITGVDAAEGRMPVGISLEVSTDGVAWKTVTLTGSISGTLDLEKAQEIKYAKITFEEDLTDGDIDSLPIGIKRVKMFGCPRETTAANCTEDSTRVSNNHQQYRHIGYDPLMEIFYFCDVNPYKEGLYCYANHAGTSKFVELPQYIDYIEGYSASDKRMYFKDKSGAILASKDGVRMTIMPIGEGMPDDVADAAAVVVPGSGKDMPAVELAGGYKADFFGVEYNGQKVITWSSCCTP